MTAHDLPPINAGLNALSTLFILLGVVAIKTNRRALHIASMVSALSTSAAFLACYLVYHFAMAGHVTRFAYPGWPKALYFAILIPHTLLAVVTVPMVFLTVIPALRERYDRHRRVARWTWPVWLYVSVTGVLVYLMLYVWYPAPRVGV